MVGWVALASELAQLGLAVRRLGPDRIREVVPATQGDPKLLEAFYATPNPSAHVHPCPPPDGHWHMCWSHSGVLKYSYWTEEVLVEDDVLYLKGRGKTGPKGNFFLHQGRDTGKTGKGKSKAK